MGTHSPPSPLAPPLRVSRHTTRSPFDDGDDHIPRPLPAGPSRTPRAHTDTDNEPSQKTDDDEQLEDDPDAQSTPKMPVLTAPAQPPSPEETPAARLRAVLARAPKPVAAPARTPAQGRPPSEVESDFDPPRFAGATPRESLKDLFSRALREPGDTPRKDRGRRRNSIDISEVEASPRADRERAKNKGKRRSLSDEEADMPSASSQQSGKSSSSSSRAAAWIALREKVERAFPNASKTSPFSVGHNRYEHDALNDSNESNDTASFLQDFDSSQATPPAAHSTPQRSLQMPSQLQSQSNLLESDSEMHHAMKGFDSSGGESDTGHRPHFPASRPPVSVPSPGYAKATSPDPTHGKGRGSPSLSRQGSGNTIHKNMNSTHSDKGRTQISFPGRSAEPHHHSHKPSNSARLRTHSSASVGSAESSKTDSVGSRSDHRARTTEKDRNLDRERQRNRAHPTPRPVSSLQIHPPADRPRTTSHPVDPVHSLLSPDRAHHRTHSFSSSDADSTEDSLASHHLAKERELEILHEIEHGRERNWNAPQPKWPVASVPHSHAHAHSHSNSPTRVRTESTSSLESRTNLRKSPELRRSPVKSPPPAVSVHRPATTPRSPEAQRPSSSTLRPHSPSRPIRKQNGDSSPGNSPAFGARPTWQFPRSRTPLPPLESNSDDMERPYSPSPTPAVGSSGKSSQPMPKSHIPVRTTKKPQIQAASSVDSDEEHRKRLTAHSITMDRAASTVNEIMSTRPDSGSADEHESDHSAPPHADPPTVRQAGLSGLSAPQSESPRRTKDDEARLQRLVPSSSGFQPASSLPTPSELPTSSEPAWSLATPPRRPSFSATRIEFQSPSPPADLPDLPEPPSTDDGKDEIDQKLPDRPLDNLLASRKPDITAFATPKPPGAWASTPHPAVTSENRAYSLPVESKDVLHQNGLVTPVSTLSRASALLPQTPFLPGAWMATPNRKSILKVRFDVEAPNSQVSVNGDESSGIVPGALKESPLSEKGADTSTAESEIAAPTPVRAKESQEGFIMRTGTPVSRESSVLVSPRSPRKSPSIRVVDAFGRISGGETVKGKKDGANESVNVGDVSGSRTTVRLVDAMGREVTEGEGESKYDGPLKREEALARVRTGLTELANGLDEEDTSTDDAKLDQQLVSRLQAESREARDIRTKLSQSLATVRKAEMDLKSKYTSFRTGIKKSNSWIHGWSFWTLVTVQLILAVLMYRISAARARVMFLTTYYDPFYPDLHLYVAKPYTHNYSFSSSYTYPPRTISSVLEREGWLALLPVLWDRFVASVSALQTHAWEAWGAGTYGQKVAWPPT